VIQFQVSPHVLWSLGGLYAILVVASAWVMMLRWRTPEKDRTELVQRIRSWWLIVSIFTLVIIMSRNISVAFFAFVTFFGSQRVSFDCPDAARRQARAVLVVSIDPCAVLLGRSSLVWNVYHLHSRVRVSLTADAYGDHR
jgi:predicted CDP-diglyceride synthetase/phosphatidate cytidylyltransferase